MSLRGFVDHLSAMLAYWDSNQRCRFANRAYEQWFGVDSRSMQGRDMREFLGPLYELNRPYIEGVLRGEPQEFERDIPDPKGGPPRPSLAQYLPDVVDGVVRGFFVVVTDASRLKRAEAALLKMERKVQANERLFALGTLAAGISHEINNPLTWVAGNIELALEGLEAQTLDLPLIRAGLVDAQQGTERLRDIVQSMKLLARSEASPNDVVDVDEALESSIAFASSSLRYHARIVRDYGNVGYVRGNGSQLSQVFVNLLMNAAQALPPDASAVGIIRARTFLAAAAVVVEISDNGCGIPDAIQSRIFDPFYTTKDHRNSMGLGLSISAAIVKAMGGELALTSRVGEGTVVRIAFSERMRAFERVADAACSCAVGKPPARITTMRPSVLVVDDEPAVANTLARMLAKEADVVVKTSAKEALELLLHDESCSFDLIFCDLMMPEVDGSQLYSTATESRPELAERFIFMTGGAFTNDGRRFLSTTPVPVLDKPFNVARVRALLRDHIKER